MKRILFAICSLLVMSCNSRPETNIVDDDLDTLSIIRDFYYEHGHDTNFSCFKRVIIINELGPCMNCNNSFCLTHQYEIDDESVLFIVSSYGMKIDISHYILHQHNNNVIWDSTSKFNDLLPIGHCEIIDL